MLGIRSRGESISDYEITLEFQRDGKGENGKKEMREENIDSDYDGLDKYKVVD